MRTHLLVGLSLLACLPLASAEESESTPFVARALARAISTGGIDPAQVSLLAVFSDSTTPFAAVHPEQPLIPASSQKLLTTACALDRLGPTTSFTTEFRAAAPPASSGVLAGDLALVGGGDPQLQIEQLWAAVAELSALGLRRVTGDVVLDDSLFSGPARPDAWPTRQVTNPYDASQGAAALAWNSIEIIVRPGAKLGSPALVTSFPLNAGARIAGSVRTASKTRITVHPLPPGKDATGGVRIAGSIAHGGRPWRRWIHLGDPAAVTLAALEELFQRAGIQVEGHWRRGSKDGLEQLLSRHDSKPLWQLCAAINKYSSNFGAEILARQLALATGNGSSAQDGSEAIRLCLEEWGLLREGIEIVDGSGYSRQNRLDARLLVQLLRYGLSHAEWGPEWLVSLPRAGEDGSLRKRLRRLRHRLRAKTGTLRGVTALAGTGRTLAGREFYFAILINESPAGAAVGPWLADRLALALFEDAENAPAAASSSKM